MDSGILLGKILQRFSDRKAAHVEGYKAFSFIRETDNSVFVTREAGEDTPIPFQKILLGIEAYKLDPNLYHQGPTALRAFDITHITSPVWALLHLLEVEEYE